MCQTAAPSSSLFNISHMRTKPPMWEYAARSYNYVFFNIGRLSVFMLTMICALCASNLTYVLVWLPESRHMHPSLSVAKVLCPDTRLMMVLSLLYTPVFWLASGRLRRPIPPESMATNLVVTSSEGDTCTAVAAAAAAADLRLSALSDTPMSPTLESMFEESSSLPVQGLTCWGSSSLLPNWLSSGLSNAMSSSIWQSSLEVLHITLGSVFTVVIALDIIFQSFGKSMNIFYRLCRAITIFFVFELTICLWKTVVIVVDLQWSHSREWTPFGHKWNYEGYGDPEQYANLKRFNRKWAFYSILPLRTFSRWWGQFNQIRLPVYMRSPAFRLYCYLFGCKLYEAEIQDLRCYPNLCAFFQRRLRPSIRPISIHNVMTCPVDGRVLHLGPVTSAGLEQVKGINYSLRGFLGPSTLSGLATTKSIRCRDSGTRPRLATSMSFPCISDCQYQRGLLRHCGTRLYQCIIYLAPGDYHHFHSPADWSVMGRRHFPGELFSVRPDMARWLQGLFNLNERVLCAGQWQYGFFSMTAVGATNVGSISLDFDKALKTNISNGYVRGSYTYHDATFNGLESESTRNIINPAKPECSSLSTDGGIELRRGDHMGDFNLGSTVVLLFEAPTRFHFLAEPGDTVRFGQGLGQCA